MKACDKAETGTLRMLTPEDRAGRLDSLVGARGADGLNGRDGADGANGLHGASGRDGTAGSKGANGANGTSAYAVAKANGCAGTEQQWLASLNSVSVICAEVL